MNDYISKRLQIRIADKAKSSESHQHPHMIHARLMNVNAFIQILIESNLIKKDELNLKKWNENSLQSDLLFVLPDALKDFYLA